MNTTKPEPSEPAARPVEQELGHVAEVKCGRLQWAIPRDDYRLQLRFLSNDTHPLYDQAALDAAVAAERERLAKLCVERAQLSWAAADQPYSAEVKMQHESVAAAMEELAGELRA